VEGAFRNGCEAAAVVLRDSSDTLTALMRAIVHDPLVEWGSDREGAAAKKARLHSLMWPACCPGSGAACPTGRQGLSARNCLPLTHVACPRPVQAACSGNAVLFENLMHMLQELEVAVSLALFSSRMAEMGPAVGAVLDSLPDALASSAAAITAFSAAFEAAAAASVNASAAHRVAQEANVSY